MLPTMDLRDAVEYVLPIMREFSMDPQESVRKSLASQLDKIVLYFVQVQKHLSLHQQRLLLPLRVPFSFLVLKRLLRRIPFLFLTHSDLESPNILRECLYREAKGGRWLARVIHSTTITTARCFYADIHEPTVGSERRDCTSSA
jgi:hypothetical protein